MPESGSPLDPVGTAHHEWRSTHDDSIAIDQKVDTLNLETGTIRADHVQNNDSDTTNNVEITLIDHIFADAGGVDGEDWEMIWSLKVCTDTDKTDSHYQLDTHDGAVWTLRDHCHVIWECDNLPGSPSCRPILLENTNWSGNRGLRFRITGITNRAQDFTTFQDPSVFIQRVNRVVPP